MTVVIALKSADYLQPRGRQISFEPGIIMAGDTRLSFIGKVKPNPEDDHVKVDSIGNFAIAGYAGNRDIATSVLSKLEEAINVTGDLNPLSIAKITQKMLYNKVQNSQSVITQVQILLGIRDVKTNMFVLYEMSGNDGFEPHPQDGMATIGSHGSYVKAIFEEVRRKAVQLPNDPFKGPRVTLKENLAPFVCFMLDEAIKTAAQIESTPALIGGKPHLIALHLKGIEAMCPDDNLLLRP